MTRSAPTLLVQTETYAIYVQSNNGPMADRQLAWLRKIAASHPTPPAPTEAHEERPGADETAP